MRTIRKALLAAAAVLALAPASASAFTGISVGAPVSASLSSATIAFGSFASCTGANFGGSITTNAGAGSGGTFSFATATFGGCSMLGSAATVTAESLPWSWSHYGTYGTANLSVKLVNPAFSCRYTGSLGFNYTATSGAMAYAGSLVRIPVSGPLCPLTVAVSGTQRLLDGAALPVQP
ncbi:MAG TPA: hypothetical protein VN238_13415 [Solirubrobacteraceae bacterium]|nr:hypothetical protein [Solirubrobacteraceae bacterium]